MGEFSMKKLANLPESVFLKVLFAFFTAAFLIAAVCMPDRSTMFSGLVQILTQPSKVSTNYFAVGGYAATFLNMGLVGLICLILFAALKANVNNVSTLAFILTVGFGSWGINILNIWPTILGVVIYGLVKKEKMGSLVNAMLFSTGIAPIVTDMLIRYPHAEVIGFNLPGLGMALLVGLCIGFFLNMFQKRHFPPVNDLGKIAHSHLFPIVRRIQYTVNIQKDNLHLTSFICFSNRSST